MKRANFIKFFFRPGISETLGRRKILITLLILGITLLFLLPVLSIFQIVFFPELTTLSSQTPTREINIWKHLFQTTLPVYMRNSAILVVLTGTGAFLLGVSTAWFTSQYQFFTRNILTWALVLPFAIPTYISAYLYGELLDYSGPVQIFFRSLIGVEAGANYFFPPVRSLVGASIILSLCLYPYVYLLARKSFYEHSFSLARAQEIMGLDNFRGFIKLSLPMARPAIAVGVILVVLETLNEFGAVEHLAVQTISVGVYNLWFNLSDLSSATRLALVTLVIVITLIALEQNSRRMEEQFQREGSTYDPPRKSLSITKQILIASFCWMPVILGFIAPMFILSQYAIRNASGFLEPAFLQTILNSVFLGLFAAVLGTLIALFVAAIERNRGRRRLYRVEQVVNLGYAIPGTILAIGLIIPLGLFDNWLDANMERLFGIRTGLLISGTGAAIVLAYTIRFSSIALGSARSTYKKISPNIDYAGKLLGYSNQQILFRFHLPLLKRSLLTGFLIIFIDSLKELSATIILRPFDFETLAVHIYSYASGELIEEAAPACLFLVLMGLIPILILTRTLVERESPVEI